MLLKLGAGDSNLEVNSAGTLYVLIDEGSKYQLNVKPKALDSNKEV